jgi:LPXTG-motif cell wall-anchored protein
VNITSPAENASFPLGNVEIQWTVEGNSFVVANISITVDNGTEVRLPATATNYVITGAGVEEHHVNITVSDGQNGSAFQSVMFTITATIDNGKPGDNTSLIAIILIGAAIITVLAAILVYRKRRKN